MKSGFSIAMLIFSVGCSSLPSARMEAPYTPCSQDEARLGKRSKELAAIVKADQEDRIDWQNKPPEEMAELARRDERRRKRVGEIFGEGCFSHAKDYAAAALVFQHGDAPDHHFQTFLWSQRAVELGDRTQRRMMALGIDRYLVSSGRRQLFGSQASKPDLKPETCWCLQQIETTFPDRRRREYAGKTLAEAIDWLKELNAGKSCPLTECAVPLRPTPKGTVPGFW